MKPRTKALLATIIVFALRDSIDYIPQQYLKPLTDVLVGALCISVVYGLFYLGFSPSTHRAIQNLDPLNDPYRLPLVKSKQAAEKLRELKAEWKKSGEKGDFLTYYLKNKQKQ